MLTVRAVTVSANPCSVWLWPTSADYKSHKQRHASDPCPSRNPDSQSRIRSCTDQAADEKDHKKTAECGRHGYPDPRSPNSGKPGYPSESQDQADDFNHGLLIPPASWLSGLRLSGARRRVCCNRGFGGLGIKRPRYGPYRISNTPRIGAQALHRTESNASADQWPQPDHSRVDNPR
jgi:hypothetical protein